MECDDMAEKVRSRLPERLVSAGADRSFRYDVAFSFLIQDEALAVDLNGRLKDRLTTFIRTHRERQETSACGAGEEAFSVAFAKHARTVVVLYRSGWGERGSTDVEAVAMRNRSIEFGYDFATFIPLDNPSTVPEWLPRNRIWIGLARWGVEHAATVIESRVQEAWGTPKESTAADIVARAIGRRLQIH
jgi:hypothetical protein